MNDTVPSPDTLDSALGHRVGHALNRHSVTGMTVDLGAVHRGARRRRRRRSGVSVVALLAVVVGAGAVLAQRDLPPPAATNPSVPLPPPQVIGAAAVLPDSYGVPVALYANAGGVPVGAPLPRIDVWDRGTTRVVVRTFDESLANDQEFDNMVVATTAAESPDVAAGAAPRVEQLAHDQWVKVFGANQWESDAVTVRGVTRDEAQELFDSLVATNGALAPPSDFVLVQHVDAQPASTPTGWYAQSGFGDPASRDYANGFGDVWVGASELVDGRDTLELAAGFLVGAIKSIDGREVFFDHRDERGTGTSMRWIDPSGVMVFAFSSNDLDERVIDDVGLVTQRTFEVVAGDLSRRLAGEPARAQAVVDGVPLTLRGTPSNVVGCLGEGEGEQCFFDVNASLNSRPTVGTISALVNDEWVIAGFYELGVEGYPDPDLSDDRTTTLDGTVLPVVTGIADGFAWMVIRVPPGVDTIFPDVMGEIGGVSRANRPLVIGPLG